MSFLSARRIFVSLVDRDEILFVSRIVKRAKIPLRRSCGLKERERERVKAGRFDEEDRDTPKLKARKKFHRRAQLSLMTYIAQLFKRASILITAQDPRVPRHVRKMSRKLLEISLLPDSFYTFFFLSFLFCNFETKLRSARCNKLDTDTFPPS